jgi:hypothetical protein
MSEELKTKIIRAIQQGEVTMRPKWHFVLRGVLYVLGISIVVLGLLFLSSFILFLLRQNGVFFGLHGLRSFFFALPWLLVFAALLFIVVLEILARFYGLGRKTPLLYSALGVIGLVFFATFVIGKVAFHERMHLRAMDGRLPFVGKMYQSLPVPRDIHRGRVHELIQNGFILVERREGTTSVSITPQTRLPHGIDFTEEDSVVVIGQKVHGGIVAEGVLRVDPEMFDSKGRGSRGKHFFMLERGPVQQE